MSSANDAPYPPLSPGTPVRTTQENPALRGEWCEPDARKWGVEGTVGTHHDGHGLCYEVTHADGTVGCYDPTELEALTQAQP